MGGGGEEGEEGLVKGFAVGGRGEEGVGGGFGVVVTVEGRGRNES